MKEPFIWSRDDCHSSQHFGWVSSWNLVATGRELRLCWVQQGWHYESSNCWHFKHATAPAAQRVWRRLGNSSETSRSVWKKPNQHYESVMLHCFYFETSIIHERHVLLLIIYYAFEKFSPFLPLVPCLVTKSLVARRPTLYISPRPEQSVRVKQYSQLTFTTRIPKPLEKMGKHMQTQPT